MPIKKSQLEQKWYYRVVKVFFLVLPFLVALFLVWRGYIVIPNVLQKDFQSILEKNVLYISSTIVGLILYYVFGQIVWNGILYLIFGGVKDDTKPVTAMPNPQAAKNQEVIPLVIIIVCLVVGAVYMFSSKGAVNGPSKLSGTKSNTFTYGASCKGKEGRLGLYGTDGSCYTCANSTPATTRVSGTCSNGPAGVYCCSGNNVKCVATGCGNTWRCNGSYYLGGVQLRVDQCFPSSETPRQIYNSWVGTCRQCP